MKTWVILLSLYAEPNALSGMLLVPGAFTQTECARVKMMMDRDHEAVFASHKEDITRLYATTRCIDRAHMPDEMVK